MSRLFLVRYEHTAKAVFVDFADGPLLDADAQAFRRVRRVADSYQFFTWESQRGDTISAHFSFTEDFFSLPDSPESLKGDVKWLSLEMGTPALASVDVGWVACVARALMTEDEAEEEDRDG